MMVDTMLCGKQWSLIAAVVVCLLSSAVKGELRCHCNQASCVATGYMCKTKTRCFSDVQRGLHGCLRRSEELPRCQGLHCCDEDMCNYVHYDYARAPQHPGPQDDCVECSDRLALIVSAMRKEVWFKAAVIAVPIAGACVLALLAIAAARLLRSDRRTLRRGPHPIYYPPKGTLLAFPRTLKGDLRDTLLPWSKDKSTTIV